MIAGLLRISTRNVVGFLLLAVAFTISCRSRTPQPDPAATQAALKSAHEAYVQAINANKVDTWMGTLGDDVVYFIPNQRAVVGKNAVATWATRYLQEVTTHWTKTLAGDFDVSGDWATARYTYTASDSVIIRDPETDGGGTANDSGWGLIVYRRGRDGRWLVARDAWGSDRPAR